MYRTTLQFLSNKHMSGYLYKLLLWINLEKSTVMEHIFTIFKTLEHKSCDNHKMVLKKNFTFLLHICTKMKINEGTPEPSGPLAAPT